MVSRLFLVVGFVVVLPALLQAQPYNRSQLQRQQQQQRGAVPVELQGRIQGVAKGGIVVATNNNQMWRVGILPITKTQVTGTTTVGSLRTGLIVEFVAEINDHGVIQGKVDALTITSLSQEKQMGMAPAGEAKGDDVVDGFAADAKKDTGDAGTKHAKKAPRVSGKAAARTAQPAGSYRIIGQLIVGRGNAMSVQSRRGAPPLPFELAEQAKIDIDTADISFAGRGNEVSVKGFAVAGRSGMMQAAEIRIKLPEPQAGEDTEPAARPEAKKPAKRAKKAKDEGLPEPDGDR